MRSTGTVLRDVRLLRPVREQRMRGIRIVKWTFLVIGLCFTVGAAWSLYAERRFIASADTAEATVVEVLTVEVLSGRKSFTPVVRFRTGTGNEITYTEP